MFMVVFLGSIDFIEKGNLVLLVEDLEDSDVEEEIDGLVGELLFILVSKYLEICILFNVGINIMFFISYIMERRWNVFFSLGELMVMLLCF